MDVEELARRNAALDYAIEEAIVQLIERRSPLEVARSLVRRLGGPAEAAPMDILDWITARRGG